jgi:hypothetical protein
MISKEIIDMTTIDPVDLLDAILWKSWRLLCEEYDVSARFPDHQTIFVNADLNAPRLAAETVLSNMLIEVIENIGRFSPYYKMPARAFGLISMRDFTTGKPHWILAPDAVQRWQGYIDLLSEAIHKNVVVLQAVLLVEKLTAEDMFNQPRISVQCKCDPPKRIRLNKACFEKSRVVCDECKRPFS